MMAPTCDLDPASCLAILTGIRQGLAFVALMAGGLGLVAWIYRNDRRR